MSVQSTNDKITFRTFRSGDGPLIAEAWTEAAPADPISYRRFRDLVLLDRNFDPAGLVVATDGTKIVGAAYGVRRLVAHHGDDLEPDTGWIPFFFVRPGARGQGIGGRLVEAVLVWLAGLGVHQVVFSAYTPNYVLPGLDADRYPAGHRLLTAAGFSTRYQCVAMDRSLTDYRMPDTVRQRIDELRRSGWQLGPPSGDDLVDLIDIAGNRFNPDWSRAIREAVVAGLDIERIMIARDPGGRMLGWAMCGAYENVLERFGPFGVIPEARGTGLGEMLLHLTLERMLALGAHSAWFLWTGAESPAGHLYRKTGFTITRTFTIMHCQFEGRNP